MASRISATARGLMVGRGGDDVPKRRDNDREGQDEEAIEPKLRGFLHVALMRHLSVAPISERDRIVEKFLKVRTTNQAKAYIAEATEIVRAHKLLHPIKKPWRRGKK